MKKKNGLDSSSSLVVGWQIGKPSHAGFMQASHALFRCMAGKATAGLKLELELSYFRYLRVDPLA